MQELRIAEESDAPRWNDFAQRHGTIFHLFEWSRVLKTYGYSPRYYFLEQEGEFNSILPCVMTKRKGLVSLPFVDYITLESFEIAEKVWNSCKAEGISFEHYTTSSYSIDSLSPNRFATTFEVDLSVGMEKLWKDSFTKKMRNQIRKAEKESVHVSLIDNPQDQLDEYYGLYLKTMKRIGALPHTKVFLERVISELRPYVRLFSAIRADRSIGFLLTFAYEGRLHIWGNVSDPNYLWASPNNLLYYNSIRYGLDNKLNKVDFGSTQEASGHAHFKDSFGGESHPIYRISNRAHGVKKYPTIARLLTSLPYPISQKVINYIFANFS